MKIMTLVVDGLLLSCYLLLWVRNSVGSSVEEIWCGNAEVVRGKWKRIGGGGFVGISILLRTRVLDFQASHFPIECAQAS